MLRATGQEKLQAFAALTRRQALGEPLARQQLAALKVDLEDGYRLFNLYNEWRAAFGYEPGRLEALPIIAALAERALAIPDDESLPMYQSPEWAELLRMRSPCNAMAVVACKQCSRSYPIFYTSGFYDAQALLCRRCGDVYYKGNYDDSPTPLCSCGGEYVRNCPDCDSSANTWVAALSPYKYFAEHRFVRGPGA